MDCLFRCGGPVKPVPRYARQLVVVLAQCSDDSALGIAPGWESPLVINNHPQAAPRSCPGRASDGLDRVGSLEFVCRFEERVWKLAGATVPITYIAWSLWLILSGLVLAVR
jgi:hypothetical protein